MDLEKTWHALDAAVSSLDFEKIWPGFRPLKFALYDSGKCFFDGRWVEKTDAFTANTSIEYEGEQIAIWMLQEELDLSVLASKIVHEMFHGFQTLEGWTCWPDEMEALFRYAYGAENLALKLRENELLAELSEGFGQAAFRELLSLRKLRQEKYPYEFSYEIRTEEIEGTAHYVEWQVLKQLDEDRAETFAGRMRSFLTKPENLFPVRISCYQSGALMIHALRSAGLYDFGAPVRPVLPEILKDVFPAGTDIPGLDGKLKIMGDAVRAYEEETERIVRSALERDETVLEGPLGIRYVNIYDARCWKGYLTSTYFLMYREGEEDRMISGDFVIRMRDEKTIDRVYRWK